MSIEPRTAPPPNSIRFNHFKLLFLISPKEELHNEPRLFVSGFMKKIHHVGFNVYVIYRGGQTGS